MGRTFQIALDHVPADIDLAERLRGHLKPLLRKGTAQLWHPDAVLPGTSGDAAGDALLDADLFLVLLSPDYQASDAAYERLRVAWAHQREGLLRLVPVLARPCTVDTDEFPGLQPVPAGKPISAYASPDDACHEVVAWVRQVLDLLAAHPFGLRPTVRRVATEAFRLDRLRQWAEVKTRCAEKEHGLFLLYGRRGQAVAFFAERVRHLLEHAQGTPHLVVDVPIRNRVANAGDIENRLRIALAEALGAPALDAAALLQRLTRRARLFLVLGAVQDERWPARERDALQNFLTTRLPALLPRDGHPVQALLMIEYERPDRSLRPWVDGWAGTMAGPLRYWPLPEAVLPSWEEVAEVLARKDADEETVAALRRFYDELTGGSEPPSFERLADELDQYLK